jgi:hypothetical protein
MNHGGKRAGSGRKPTSTKRTVTLKLEGAVIDLLHARIPSGKRTGFIERSILAALEP